LGGEEKKAEILFKKVHAGVGRKEGMKKLQWNEVTCTKAAVKKRRQAETVQNQHKGNFHPISHPS